MKCCFGVLNQIHLHVLEENLLPGTCRGWSKRKEVGPSYNSPGALRIQLHFQVTLIDSKWAILFPFFVRSRNPEKVLLRRNSVVLPKIVTQTFLSSFVCVRYPHLLPGAGRMLWMHLDTQGWELLWGERVKPEAGVRSCFPVKFINNIHINRARKFPAQEPRAGPVHIPEVALALRVPQAREGWRQPRHTALARGNALVEFCSFLWAWLDHEQMTIPKHLFAN